ncbi:hypothetical protein ACJW30_10G097600 [Castanea mollissima]
MASNVSEARRRKIMERGSDRLALITGRIQSLPPSSSHEEITTDSDNPSSQPLISHTTAGFERAAGDENETSSLNGYGWAEQVGNTLETGLVMQKALDAIFMDCSVYAIIVICGLSLASLFS